MKELVITGWLLVGLLSATFAVAAPEDRFKGAGYDGYDKQAIGAYASMNDSWGRLVGGAYDGYDKQTIGSYASMNDSWGRLIGGMYDGYANGTVIDAPVRFPSGSVYSIR